MKAAILALAVLLAGCDHNEQIKKPTWPYDSQEDSYLGIYTDPETGCQYVAYHRGGLTPRMGADGKQICKARFHSDNEVRNGK